MHEQPSPLVCYLEPLRNRPMIKAVNWNFVPRDYCGAIMFFKALILFVVYYTCNSCTYNQLYDKLSCFGEELFLRNNSERIIVRVIESMDQVPNISTIFSDELVNHIQKYYPTVQEFEYKARNCTWKPTNFGKIKSILCHEIEDMDYDIPQQVRSK